MKRNPIAQDVRTQKYRLRIVRAKKGKGSYNRKKISA
jgi:stalled ribosome alternative rescue factor ArfA